MVEQVAQIPPWKEAVKTSPLFGATAELSLTNSWVRWGDYSVVRTYTTWEEEYEALRRHIGICDLTPRIRYRVAGDMAHDYLNRLVTRDLEQLSPGASCVSLMCNSYGHVIDIVRIERVEESIFYLLCSDHHLPWLLDSAEGYEGLDIQEATAEDVTIGLYGLASCALLLAVGAQDVDKLDPDRIEIFKIAGSLVVISRKAAYGELGYEIRVMNDDALLVWDRLVRAGRPLGLKPVGMDALDSARIEAGHLKFGQDYLGAHAAIYGNRPRNPYELGLQRLVDLDGEHFNGRTILRRRQETPGRTLVVGLDMDWVTPTSHRTTHQARVLKEGQLVGTITSCTWSPKLKRLIGIATLTHQAAKMGDVVEVDLDQTNELEPVHMHRQAVITELPFYGSPAQKARATGK